MTPPDEKRAALPLDEAQHGTCRLGPGALLLRGFAREAAESLIAGIGEVTALSPFRNMLTPGGRTMSVAMSNCGELGWISDRKSYRYTSIDPESGRPWPAMPAGFADLAQRAAAAAGFTGFHPDACLINGYMPGTRLTLHQDRDERDYSQPIVSVSLGLPAIFLWGGLARGGKVQRVPLVHGDVVVWGGPDRLRFHGVDELADGLHALTGAIRFNLTLRKAGR